MSRLAAPLLLAAFLSPGCNPAGRSPSETASPPPATAPAARVQAVVEARAEWPELIVQVVEATRTGGILSVQLLFVNGSAQPFDFGNRFASDPADRGTLADAVVVDGSGLRKYFVLRDRANRPLSDAVEAALQPGERRLVRVRFPAPPDGTSRINIQIPHVPVLRDVPILQEGRQARPSARTGTPRGPFSYLLTVEG